MALLLLSGHHLPDPCLLHLHPPDIADLPMYLLPTPTQLVIVLSFLVFKICLAVPDCSCSMYDLFSCCGRQDL